MPRGRDTRPATDRMRESAFGILGESVRDSEVLDLFAGSGSFGIEALSRGARSCVFVDIAHRSFECIKRNLAELGLEESALVVRLDAFRFVRSLEENFDLCFVDPPYRFLKNRSLTEKLEALLGRLVKLCGLVIFHHLKKYPVQSDAFEVADCRDYGQASLSFLKAPD